MPTPANDPRVTQYRRMAALVTHATVLHPVEKSAAIAAAPMWRRKQERTRLESSWAQDEAVAAADVEALVSLYESVIAAIDAALDRVGAVGLVRLEAKVTEERGRLVRARGGLAEVRAATRQGDFAAAGRALREADRELWSLGAPVLMELRTASYTRELRTALAENQSARKAARAEVERARRTQGEPEAFRAGVDAYRLMARALELLAEVLAQDAVTPSAQPRTARIGDDNAIAVVPPQELERLDDVGGLHAVKDLLRRTLTLQLERAEEAARYGVGRNNVLLYGPPGTGKTLLARAVAGEYGLRYLRVTPATVASPYQHEAARNLGRVFDLARRSAPCLLLLDEVDSLGSARTGMPSVEHREIVTQLLTLLDEYRSVPRLVIMGTTNAVELLDPALREGRFDTKVPVPLPDAEARREILDVHLRRRSDAVAWDGLDLDELAQLTAGRSGAALATLVSVAAEQAIGAGRSIGQTELIGAVGEREARDRVALETPVRWEDVVLPAGLEGRLREIVQLVQHPEMAQAVGITPPAGILLHGPPGTGKTTIAKALATEVRASFYELSAADMLSKWVGESEERVSRVFARARENRPSIIFIDEIDGLLRRRGADSSSPWEERVVSQFLRELDGLQSQPGVFLVGATNRLDIIDEAIKDRRLIALEVPLPDLAGRRAILDVLFARVRASGEVDLDELARATDGLSGADLRRLRDEIGMKALSRTLRQGLSATDVQVVPEDYYASLQDCRTAVIPD